MTIRGNFGIFLRPEHFVSQTRRSCLVGSRGARLQPPSIFKPQGLCLHKCTVVHAVQSVFTLNYMHFVSAGYLEMEREYTCPGELFPCDLLERVSVVALMKGLVVCGWYQSLSHSRPLTNPISFFNAGLKSFLMLLVILGEKQQPLLCVVEQE